MKITNRGIVLAAFLELGAIFGIGYLYDWRAGVAAFLGAMLVSIRIAGADTSTK